MAARASIPLSAALTKAIPFFAGMVRFMGMSSRALRLLLDNDQRLLGERTIAYRPLSALQIFRDLMYPQRSDLHMIGGRSGCPRALPVSPGARRVGVVEALGQGVSELTVGARVLLMECWNLWRERAVCRADRLFAFPDENLSCRSQPSVRSPLTLERRCRRATNPALEERYSCNSRSSIKGKVIECRTAFLEEDRRMIECVLAEKAANVWAEAVRSDLTFRAHGRQR